VQGQHRPAGLDVSLRVLKQRIRFGQYRAHGLPPVAGRRFRAALSSVLPFPCLFAFTWLGPSGVGAPEGLFIFLTFCPLLRGDA